MIKYSKRDLSRISRTERKMVEEILALKEREVNKIMVPVNEVTGFSYDVPLKQVIACYRKNHFSRFPVYYKDMDHIVGILYIKDIFAFWDKYRDYPVIEFVRFPHFVYEDRSALEVFLELQRMRLSLGIIIDEFGGVSGIITVEDLLEEIVGEIEDEFDPKKEAYVKKVDDQEYIVRTRMELDDFAEYFGLKIEEDDVSTLSGLILKNADRIPQVGEKVKYRHLIFEVIEGTRRKINKVKLYIKK